MGRERKEESGSRIKREQNGDGDRNEEKKWGLEEKEREKEMENGSRMDKREERVSTMACCAASGV